MVLHTTYVLRVPYSCGVVLVFWFWPDRVFGVTYILSVQYSCAVVSVFWCGFLVLRTYLVYNTVVRLCQFFCCGTKVNFVRIPYSQDCFSKISRTFFKKKMI